MKKSSKSSLKKRSPDISLQHKNEASYKFSKKNFCTWPKKGPELKGLNKLRSNLDIGWVLEPLKDVHHGSIINCIIM